mgnify:CR=1 FL=1
MRVVAWVSSVLTCIGTHPEILPAHASLIWAGFEPCLSTKPPACPLDRHAHPQLSSCNFEAGVVQEASENRCDSVGEILLSLF